MPISEQKSNAEASISPFDDILDIPKETLGNIDSFKNRYLGATLKLLYTKHPELRDDIDEELKNAISNRKNDKVQHLIEEADFPLYPNHYRLDDFDPSCLKEEERTTYNDLIKLDFMTSDCPNVTLYGPEIYGSEKLASGLGDALCKQLYTVSYIKYSSLIGMLGVHTVNSTMNKLYDKLIKQDCLIIQDFAGEAVVDRDLLSELYTFLDTRVSNHRNSFSKAIKGGIGHFKPSATIVTSCRKYEEWYEVFDCDYQKATSIISFFHGYGCKLTIDEFRPKEEEKPSEATSSPIPSES